MTIMPSLIFKILTIREGILLKNKKVLYYFKKIKIFYIYIYSKISRLIATKILHSFISKL